jgi:hypothetical protein
MTLQTADFDPGESATATVYFEPSSHALFGGDLTGNRVTPALTPAIQDTATLVRPPNRSASSATT